MIQIGYHGSKHNTQWRDVNVRDKFKRCEGIKPRRGRRSRWWHPDSGLGGSSEPIRPLGESGRQSRCEG